MRSILEDDLRDGGARVCEGKILAVWVLAGVLFLVGCSPQARPPANAKLRDTRDVQQSTTLEGFVVSVHDGDTIRLKDMGGTVDRVRLAGIDAPEITQPFGRESQTELSLALSSKRVIIQYQKRDKYGRLVGKVLLDGRDICLDQVKKGMAWHFKRYEQEQDSLDRIAYAEAEADARARRIGLWADSSPQPPWIFRSSTRTEPEEATAAQPQERNDGSPDFGQIIGNRRSTVYHRSDCPDYEKVSPKNRVYFKSASDAEQAGFRVAGNCPK